MDKNYTPAETAKFKANRNAISLASKKLAKSHWNIVGQNKQKQTIIQNSATYERRIFLPATRSAVPVPAN